jgi:hypothetical protein
MSDDRLTTTLTRLHELRREHGRLSTPFEIHATTMDSFTADGIKRLEDQGVTHTMGGFSAANPYSREPDTEPLQAKLDALRAYADNVIAKFRP